VTTSRRWRNRRPAEIVAIAATTTAVIAAVWFSSTGPRRLTSTATASEAIAIRQDLDVLKLATIRFAQRHGRFPDALADLVPADIPALPVDPYGREYVLRSGGSDKVVLWSLGADGTLARYPPDIATIVTMDDLSQARHPAGEVQDGPK
jgi:hypothetical protein